MAPSKIEETSDSVHQDHHAVKASVTPSSYIKEPLQLKGVLDQFKSFDVTPVIGKEFVDVNLAEWLTAPNSDDLIRDLAITISRRGVVFFRAQNDITNDMQKVIVQRLGELSGKPKTSGLHINPVMNAGREGGVQDDEITTVDSVQLKKLFSPAWLGIGAKKQTSKNMWHSDTSNENVPCDYALLRLIDLPETGGDTLWASGYEVYDRISEPYQKFLESLTATHAQPEFKLAADNGLFSIHPGPRGSPENIGTDLEAIHPVVRTNPVTGWKSIYTLGHVKHINGLTADESRHLVDWFLRMVCENHDLQVRHRWQNSNDIAIWDNRSVYHAGTPDYADYGERFGTRAVSIGEKPYFDPNSVSRKEALAKLK